MHPVSAETDPLVYTIPAITTVSDNSRKSLLNAALADFSRSSWYAPKVNDGVGLGVL